MQNCAKTWIDSACVCTNRQEWNRIASGSLCLCPHCHINLYQKWKVAATIKMAAFCGVINK